MSSSSIEKQCAAHTDAAAAAAAAAARAQHVDRKSQVIIGDADSATRQWPKDLEFLSRKSQRGIGVGGANVGGEHIAWVRVSEGDGRRREEKKEQNQRQSLLPGNKTITVQHAR